MELQRSNAELEDKAALLAAQNRDIETKNAEIEQARQEIEERARQLALASKYKSQFLANMSHELRTPLNSLLILARLLAQNPGRNLTAKQVEYANVIHSAGSDLLQLINDILDLSKVEAGRMDIHAERFPLSALLEDIQATFQPLTAEKGLDFAVEADAGAPGELFTDRQRLRQVLGNLLSNAVKFTERGDVVLRVTRPPRRAPDGGDDAWPFSVADTGIGIAAGEPHHHLRRLPAGRRHAQPPLRRYRPRPVHRPRGRGPARRRDNGARASWARAARSPCTCRCELPGLAGAVDDPRACPPASAWPQNGEGHAEATEALQLQPALPDDECGRRQAPAGPGGCARRPADPARLQRGLRPDRHPRAGARGHRGQPGAGHRGAAPRLPHQCVVLDLGLEDASAFAFLERLQPSSRSCATYRCSRTPGTSSTAPRPGWPGCGSASQPLELLPSLDELRERITLHLSAAQPGPGPAR